MDVIRIPSVYLPRCRKGALEFQRRSKGIGGGARTDERWTIPLRLAQTLLDQQLQPENIAPQAILAAMLAGQGRALAAAQQRVQGISEAPTESRLLCAGPRYFNICWAFSLRSTGGHMFGIMYFLHHVSPNWDLFTPAVDYRRPKNGASDYGPSLARLVLSGTRPLASD